MKYFNSLIIMLALVFALGGGPSIAMAQTPGDVAGDEADGEDEADGNFSRQIPEGLKAGLSEEELDGFQSRLDGAETPQERNEVRRELQRLSQERHLESIKERQEEKKGFFGGLMQKLGESAKARKESDARKSKERKEKGLSSGGGPGKSGGSGRGKSGGGGRGNSGGGGGGGRGK